MGLFFYCGKQKFSYMPKPVPHITPHAIGVMRNWAGLRPAIPLIKKITYWYWTMTTEVSMKPRNIMLANLTPGEAALKDFPHVGPARLIVGRRAEVPGQGILNVDPGHRLQLL